ncbi:serine/threonine kinase PKN8 [Plesiocystis pacifica SIR-1]|uniref:Serine/threonine kinase PKN8 n=1 Tax=Plesiocystis pacifica SIR-1 TaxID=391625 RepID=A6GIW6_9BACT|nr:serine/threonine-protein kinase [Plesiocystis pacifica]EDM74201.1 serine/threonine kinase PKN8 [Plesiocystis pacifica SIR-1]
MEDSPPDAILSIEDAFYEARMFKAFGADQYPQSVRIADRFELLDRIGKGSYGTVFLAQDHQLGRKVAVKVMPLGDLQVAEREGKLLAELNHPHVVRIHDYGAKDDYRYLVLELLEGPTLGEWCQGKSPRAIVQRYLEAGEGLEAAHRQGLVHRDFKPGNVRLDGEGRAVVLDFGLARHLDSLHGEVGSPEQVYGTYAYLPPEALRGQRVGEQGDQFSFCVSLWEALSGRNPFALEGRELETRFRAIQEPPQGATRIPRRLRPVLRRGLAPLPGDRWPTMTLLLEALRETQESRRWPWGVGILGLSLILGWAGFHSLQNPPGQLPRGSDAFSKTDEAVLALNTALSQQDADAVTRALRAGSVSARAARLEGYFARLAAQSAVQLEATGEYESAVYAWSITISLSRSARAADTAPVAAVADAAASASTAATSLAAGAGSASIAAETSASAAAAAVDFTLLETSQANLARLTNRL